MNRKQYVFLILAVIAGLIGGRIPSLLLIGRPVFAERAPVQKVIETQELRIVDEAGNTYAEFSGREGKPHLSFYDQNGKFRIGLGLVPSTDIGEMVLSFYNQDGEPRVNLRVLPSGHTYLTVYDQDSNERIALGLGDNPYLLFLDPDKKSRISMAVNRDGSPMLTFRDSQGTPVWSARGPRSRSVCSPRKLGE